MTVRNEGNRIVQFAYNINNTDTMKIEKKQFDLVTMSDNLFKNRYKWRPSDFDNEAKFTKETINLLRDEYKLLKKYRLFYKKKSIKIIEQGFHIKRLIEQIKKQKFMNNRKKLNATYVIKNVSKLFSHIRINCQTDIFPFNEINTYNLNETRAHVLSCLASKKLIMYDKLNLEQFDKLIDKLKHKFYENLIDPGTSVGILSSQSIGEPATQLSVVYDTRVRTRVKNKNWNYKIGHLIDLYMEIYEDKVIEENIISDTSKKSYILPLQNILKDDEIIEVPGINCKTGKFEWKNVTELSKHPLIGSLIKITTTSGKSVIATKAHSFVTKQHITNKICKIKGDELKVGDLVPIACF